MSVSQDTRTHSGYISGSVDCIYGIIYFSEILTVSLQDVYTSRPLPHLIGTADFFSDELVGLEESSGEGRSLNLLLC